MLMVALAHHHDDFRCEARLYTLLGRYCMTTEQCLKYGDWYYPYWLLGMCVHSCRKD